MEQQAHHGKHTALDQYSKQPVPRYQVAACQAGQQGGDRHADADSRKELFRLHVGVSGGIGNDAVGQPRCDKRQNGIKPGVLAVAHAVQQLIRLGAVRCEQFNDFCQAARQQKHQKVCRHRCRKAGHKAFPRPIGDPCRQLDRHGRDYQRYHLHERQEPQRQKAAQPPLACQIIAQSLFVPAGKCSPYPRQQQAECFNNQQHHNQNYGCCRNNGQALGAFGGLLFHAGVLLNSKI